MLQAVVSLTIAIMTAIMLLESSIMLPENIYSTVITYDHHLQLPKYCYGTGHWTILTFMVVIYLAPQ